MSKDGSNTLSSLVSKLGPTGFIEIEVFPWEEVREAIEEVNPGEDAAFYFRVVAAMRSLKFKGLSVDYIVKLDDPTGPSVRRSYQVGKLLRERFGNLFVVIGVPEVED